MRSAPVPEPRSYAQTRRLLEAGAFERAAQQMSGYPAAEIESDPEGVVLRGLARWGAGLDRFTALAVKVGPLELVSQVKQLVEQTVREHPEGTSIPHRLTRALPGVDAEVARQGKAAGDVEGATNKAVALLEAAEADFGRALRMGHTTNARWCVAPERWLLLVRAHRYSVERERALWGRDVTGSAPAGELSPERQRRAQQHWELEKAFLRELDRQLAACEGKRGKEPKLHAAADALLAFGVSANRISRWPESGGAHPSISLEAVGSAPASLREVRTLVERDPVRAVVRLYRLCAEPRGGDAAAGAAYTNYLIDLQAGAGAPLSLATLAAELKPREVAGNPLFALERARLLSRQDEQDAALQQTVSELGVEAGVLRRPVWTAAPAPVRAAFLRLPQWLRPGRQIFVSYRPVLDKIDRSLAQADSPIARARLQHLRLQLGVTLTTSDLPWDREAGYEIAATALDALEKKLHAVLVSEQLAAYRALRTRLHVAAGQERFPAQMCAVAAGGNLVWVTSAFEPLVLPNPLVLVHRDGLTLRPPPPR